MITPAQAEQAIRSHATLLPTEHRPLATLANAVLREAVVSQRDQPPYDRVTMDGIAFASAAASRGQRTFRVAGTQAAGAPPLELPSEEACFEVMTGAMLPRGCDCVVPVERIVREGDLARLADDVIPSPDLNVHTRGLDCRAGQPLLEPGTRLQAPEIAIIASAGIAQVQVTRSPRIAVITTGDELVEPGEPVEAWQIYRSNAYAVLASLRARGHADLTHQHLPDDLAVLRTQLRAQLDAHDVFILSGGVSMGQFDYVPQVLAELGIAVVFHKIAQRPGKPMWYGVGAGGKTVYALPGNPVSTLMCLVRYVLPGLEAAMGATPAPVEAITLAEDFAVKPAVTLFLPVRLRPDEAGRASGEPRPTQGSGDFTSLAGTDGFVELPPGPQVVPKGTVVPFYRW